ncbi:MAG: PVC-type heme-binding CxxCH protein [Pirellulales bacterium]
MFRLSIFFVLSTSPLFAVEPYRPVIAEKSEEGQRTLSRIRVPEGFKVELFAAEPQLANPVAFCIDEQSRFYVAETFRYSAGVTDNRRHMDWLDDDVAARTVADRVAMYKKYLKDDFPTFETEHDRIRLIEDTDGDGTADRSSVFADGFHKAEEGIGSGLLARGGDVWYTCIPSLWKLRDNDGDGVADERQALQSGYGVHVAFVGHDLHGLRMGPDGKLYFSIGDRGLHIEHEGRTYDMPDCGSVLRCNPDGTDLEIFATGLRNPQELAFDDYGNLFTVDNNSDSGDQARLVHVVEGGDSGWRMGFQYLTSPVSRGPWNLEKLWQPRHDGQPAYILPPLANMSNGPSGLTYYPGVGLPDKYRGHFFLCDFRGGSANSGVQAFDVRPRGASFELADREEFCWSVLATDCEFGWDGALYVSDWSEGWEKPGKGRIYRVFDPATRGNLAVAEGARLIREGLDKLREEKLIELLSHADGRIRQEAQFALVKQGGVGLAVTATVGTNRLARLHAIWGMGQMARTTPVFTELLTALTIDLDAEVRAQAARVLGDLRFAGAHDRFVQMLADSEPRVQLYAALGLSRLGRGDCIPAVAEMLKANNNEDAYLRHAAVMALIAAGDAEALLPLADDASPAVRLGALLAFRRLNSPHVARFLNDVDPYLVQEAAIAINDTPVAAALPQLAEILTRDKLTETLAFRALNAHFRLGQAENAQAIAAFAARSDAPENMRVEALAMLSDWETPSGRDRVVGLWRPLEPRDKSAAANAVAAALPGIFTGPDSVRQAGAQLAARYELGNVGPLLFELAGDINRSSKARAEALRALEQLRDPRLAEATQLALKDQDPRVRAQGQRLLATADPVAGLAALSASLANGEQIERQAAFAVLADLKSPDADEVLAQQMDQLLAGKLPPELHLDLLTAAGRRPVVALEERVKQYEATRDRTIPMQRFRETLVGGDAENGARIFFERAEVSCVRCHKVRGRGGEVGPDLSKLASQKPREYLLQSLIEPDKEIAKNFETVICILDDGRTVAGIFKEEDDTTLRLVTPEGKPLEIDKSQIDERLRGKSAMPDTLVNFLTKSDVRDLVEFLSGMK